jgi:hypothetical protein
MLDLSHFVAKINISILFCLKKKKKIIIACEKNVLKTKGPGPEKRKWLVHLNYIGVSLTK